MQEMEVHDPQLTSPTPILSALRKRLDLRSKGRQRARKIRTKWVGSIGSVGSSHDSEAGIVTTNRQAQDHAKGLEQIRRHGRRLCRCYGSTKCVNPVAL